MRLLLLLLCLPAAAVGCIPMKHTEGGIPKTPGGAANPGGGTPGGGTPAPTTDPPAPKVCATLPVASTNPLCTSKYKCYAPDYVDGTTAGTKQMRCQDPKELRTNADIKAIMPTCSVGAWSDGTTPVADTTEVTCINCADVVTDPTDATKPTISANNKAVTCASGQLTVEYESGGTQQTSVTTLTCSSPDFAWVGAGGVFTPYTSLEDAVNNGIKWKARCVPIKPCASLPTMNDADYCAKLANGAAARPLAKWECYSPMFFPDNTMQCQTPPRLRYFTDGGEKLITPTCVNGQWSDGTTKIPDTTPVICLRCRFTRGVSIDQIQTAYDNVNVPTKLSCPSGQFYLEMLDANNNVVDTFDLSYIACNQMTFVWEPVGGGIGKYGTLSDALAMGIDYRARCR